MTDDAHKRWSDDLAAYVLDALEPDEAAELERHAEGCELCRREIRWLTPAVRQLPESVEHVEAPAELRSRILAEVRSDAAAAAPAAGAPLRRERARRNRFPAWLRGSGGLRPAGAVAAVLLVALLAGYLISGPGDDGSPSSTVTAGKPPGVTAKLVREGERGTLRLANVKLPENRVLEAWVRRDGEVEPVRKLFVPNHNGAAAITMADMSDVDLVMVTSEPPGGSETPTGAPIASVPVPLE
jgi:anti-sigma-K factor RskA